MINSKLVWGLSLSFFMFMNLSYGQKNAKDSTNTSSDSDSNVRVMRVEPIEPPPGGGGGGGATYRWNRDRDRDGYGDPDVYVMSSTQPTGYVANPNDCDDTNPNIHDGNYYYLDSDNDGFGDPANRVFACSAPSGYVSNNDDDCPNEFGTDNGCPVSNEGGSATLSDENYVYRRIYRQEFQSSLDQEEVTTAKATESIIYFDGLGRPMQEIGINQSEGMHDIITHIGYDNYGRQDKEYLPYVESGGTPGSYRGDVSEATKSYYKSHYSTDFSNSNNSTANPYSEKLFEASPLSRILAQGAPGDTWKVGGNHTVRSDYQTNTGSEVRLYKVTLTSSYFPSLSTSGYYLSGRLYKTVVKDENWTSGTLHTTEEFTDKQGNVVLKRTYGPADKNMDGTISSGESAVAHDTYYVYDDYGNLTYVLPPKSEPTVDKPTSGELNGLCYQYRYDSRNRLVEKRLPGKGLESIVYNNLDQPVLTQDENLAALNRWLFTKYDAYGRVAYTGYRNMGYSRKTLQDKVDGGDYSSEYVSRSGRNVYDGVDVYYNGVSIPTGITRLFTVNYYDNYDYSPSLSLPSSSQGQTIVQGASKVQGLATGSLTRVLETDQWIEVINGYDSKGRLIYIKEHNPYLETTQTTEHLLDEFTGEVAKTKTTHIKTGTGAISVTTEDFYEYDNLGRMILHTQKVNGGNEERIAENTYDELGQLEHKEVGNRKDYTALQDVVYDYNVRDWLKSINNIGSTSKLFNMSFFYNDGNGTPLYNGNISEIKWRSKNSDENGQKSYKYYYDALNRITKAHGGSASGDNGSKYNLGQLKPVAYDLNGNITYLDRRGELSSGSYGYMDELDYAYEEISDNGRTTNQLIGIKDDGHTSYGFKGGSNSIQYGYDANGNLTSDTNKDITKITYNHLNLPKNIVFNGNNSQKIEYIYDAKGIKLKKRVNNNGSVTETLYAGNFMYRGGNLDFYFHPEGYVERANGGSFKYYYQYKDHLGNIRVTYHNSGSVSSPIASIVDEHNYYPFGLAHSGYNDDNGTQGSDFANNYMFGGKEFQDESVGSNHLDYYDFGARNYDPAIGRWFVIDPLAEHSNQIDISPYNYAVNNPILYNDPDGKCPPWVCGAIAGGLVEVGSQYIVNLANGDSWREAALNIDAADVLAATVEGGITGGGSVARRLIINGSKMVVSEVVQATVDVEIGNIIEKDLVDMVEIETDAEVIATDSAIGIGAALLGEGTEGVMKAFVNSKNTKELMQVNKELKKSMKGSNGEAVRLTEKAELQSTIKGNEAVSEATGIVTTEVTDMKLNENN